MLGSERKWRPVNSAFGRGAHYMERFGGRKAKEEML